MHKRIIYLLFICNNYTLAASDLPQADLAKNTTHWCLWGTWRQEYQSLVLSLVAANLDVTNENKTTNK